RLPPLAAFQRQGAARPRPVHAHVADGDRGRPLRGPLSAETGPGHLADLQGVSVTDRDASVLAGAVPAAVARGTGAVDVHGDGAGDRVSAAVCAAGLLQL